MTTEIIMKKIEGIEASMSEFQIKAQADIQNAGKVSSDTVTALDKLGEMQREVADRLLAIEQSGVKNQEETQVSSWGKQFISNAAFANFMGGSSQKATVEISNAALVGSDATVAPDRKAGVVSGAYLPLTLEMFLNSLPTSSNAIEYTRESSFTNNAGEVAEGSASTESTPAFTLASMPMSNVTHDTPITKQLAADAPSLAAYINNRMAYGVNLKVEQQLANGNGTTPNISGLLRAGNFTAHGYAAAALGATLPKHVLIRKMIADAWSAGYPADGIVMNPADFASLEIEVLTTSAGQSRMSVNAAGQPTIFGVPVVQSIGVPVDSVLVGAFGQSATVHNRQGVLIEMSDSHASNFTSDIITIKASRRLALTVERPAGIIAGDLTPA
jgi:HK97 family phage major capsid protein